jgi:excisionase family DNA binding protein
MTKHNAALSAPNSPPPKLLTTIEAMERLRIATRGTLCGWVRAGKLPAIRMPDNSYRFDEAAIDAWLLSRATTENTLQPETAAG